MGKIYAFIKPYWGLCFLSGLTLLIFTFLGIPLPWYLKIIVDSCVPQGNRGLLVLVLIAVAFTYALREVFFYISHYLFNYTGARILFGVRVNLFKHLQTLSLRFYQEYRTGKLISNILTDVAHLNGLISSVLVNLVIHLFTIVCIEFALFMMNPKLSCLSFVMMTLQFINFTYFRKKIQKHSKTLREMMSEVSAGLSETINGIKVVKSFGKERAESHVFVGRLRPAFYVTMAQNLNGVFLWIFVEIINITCLIIVLAITGNMVISHEMNVGEMMAYHTYFSMLTGPISALSTLSTTISEGMVSIERITKLLDAIPEIQEQENPKELKNPSGHLSFEHISFGYEKDKPVLKDFNLEVAPGKKVALVGPSGSGKSTIASLLMRFFDVTNGAIKIDGVNIKHLSIASLRDIVGIVLQDSFLFSGTIEDNIRYGRQSATHEEVVAAAKMANAHDFIMEQSKGYQSPVGENGVMLSGGQKQRIAIARAILKNPSVLILDEATSALDTMSEAVVQEALDKLMVNRTTVIIAHRLSTVRNSDLICVLKDGVVEEQGSHAELLMKNGLYRELYAMQLKDRNNVKSDLFAAGEGSGSSTGKLL